MSSEPLPTFHECFWDIVPTAIAAAGGDDDDDDDADINHVSSLPVPEPMGNANKRMRREPDDPPNAYGTSTVTGNVDNGNGDAIASLGDNSNNATEIDGRWSANEQQRFLEGVMLYGKNWVSIARFMKTRTATQVRSHANKVFRRLAMVEKPASNTGEQMGHIHVHGLATTAVDGVTMYQHHQTLPMNAVAFQHGVVPDGSYYYNYMNHQQLNQLRNPSQLLTTAPSSANNVNLMSYNAASMVPPAAEMSSPRSISRGDLLADSSPSHSTGITNRISHQSPHMQATAMQVDVEDSSPHQRLQDGLLQQEQRNNTDHARENVDECQSDDGLHTSDFDITTNGGQLRRRRNRGDGSIPHTTVNSNTNSNSFTAPASPGAHSDIRIRNTAVETGSEAPNHSSSVTGLTEHAPHVRLNVSSVNESRINLDDGSTITATGDHEDPLTLILQSYKNLVDEYNQQQQAIEAAHRELQARLAAETHPNDNNYVDQDNNDPLTQAQQTSGAIVAQQRELQQKSSELYNNLQTQRACYQALLEHYQSSTSEPTPPQLQQAYESTI